MKFHLIGIGGAGMNVVARLLRSEGHDVSGSDRQSSAVLDDLQAMGITTFVGHDRKHVPHDAIVVRSTAVKPSNPELEVAVERHQSIWHRSEALAFAAGSRDFIAVAGAHGKTSTSAMISVALTELGADPSRAIGGHLAGGEPGGYLGSGPAIVAEADESDGSFLNYQPRVALVTNVEPDHLDHYGTPAAFAQAFVDFAQRIVPGGLLVCCTDDPGAADLAHRACELGIRVATYGTKPHEGDHTLIRELHSGLAGGRAVVNRADQQMTIKLAVPGEHMVLNAVGAWLVCCDLGFDGQQIAEALKHFYGTGRRFELAGEVRGIRVIDDYAHHPTEVAATLQTAKSVTSGRVKVVFQPHLYSRTRNFAAEFAQALDIADDVIVTSVYAAREVPEDGSQADVITAHSAKAQFVPDKSDAARMIVADAGPGDLIMTMGAGDIYTMAPLIISELER
ncbi:UDP-N-acetylmuramate--L-alanine ligase [Arcanobacterium phocae]|uniref:UDP-N-acetylmuramate--L-alanine ligase n=1 Tax=Arcanobacterium phocae TaxID=131112 RepID=UPI001C0F370B|nr:UDP-N-acetylmuramate--L-alanine ligase [Arcanobacterium phocae]